MVEICQLVLDGFGMPVEWILSTVVPWVTSILQLLLSCEAS